MKNNNEVLVNLKLGQDTFSRNIGLCKAVFFGLTYEDITRYTGIVQPTMLSYDKYGVSPYISVAKQIAELYCCDLDTLCGKEISYYKVEQFQMFKKFIERVKGSFVEVKNRISVWADKQLLISEYNLYEQLCLELKSEIARLNDEKRLVELKRNNSVVENFTRNFNNLHKNLGISYRKISAELDTSIGNLTRLKKGGEPMLETIIKLSAFFGVSIEQMIANEPEFNYEYLQQKVGKCSIKFGEISTNDIKFYDKMRVNILSKEQAKKLVDKLLN